MSMNLTDYCSNSFNTCTYILKKIRDNLCHAAISFQQYQYYQGNSLAFCSTIEEPVCSEEYRKGGRIEDDGEATTFGC